MSHADKWTDQFYGKETPCIKSESSAEAGYTKSTLTCNHPSVSVDVGVSMPDIVIENIKHSEESIMFYTVLPDVIAVQAVLNIESLIIHGADNIWTQSVGEMNIYTLGRKHKCEWLCDWDDEAKPLITCQGLRTSIQNIACSNVCWEMFRLHNCTRLY